MLPSSILSNIHVYKYKIYLTGLFFIKIIFYIPNNFGILEKNLISWTGDVRTGTERAVV